MTATEEQAIAEAAEQIGLSVAANLFPLFYVAQNVYDTVQSLTEVWNARESKDEMAKLEAGIDLIFAVIGWVPVVGAGVKKTFRLVNQRSEIYGPLLFDILRLVLQRAHIQASPEQLVDKLFDAAGLKKLLTGAREHIEKSWLYLELPASGQTIVNDALVYGQENLPLWLTMFVERKLMHWRRKQPNSAAASTLEEHRTTDKPGAKGEEAKAGANRPVPGASRGVVNAKLAVTDITTSITGILGEHIGDYYCYEKLKWGSGWQGHDKGLAGTWSDLPGLHVMGKLNDKGKLNKLFDLKARGHGIDGVWRASPATNDMKDFAIVEVKSSTTTRKLKNEDAKPTITSKLGTIKEAIRPGAEDLLEPPDGDGLTSAGRGSGKPGVGKPTIGSGKPSSGGGKPSLGGVSGGSGSGRKQQSDSTPPSSNSSSGGKGAAVGPNAAQIARIQMSHSWIEARLPDAFSSQSLADTVARLGYSRHLLYVPFYLPSAVEHVAALRNGDEHAHEDHAIPSTHHYRDKEVGDAVKLKASRIR